MSLDRTPLKGHLAVGRKNHKNTNNTAASTERVNSFSVKEDFEVEATGDDIVNNAINDNNAVNDFLLVTPSKEEDLPPIPAYFPKSSVLLDRFEKRKPLVETSKSFHTTEIGLLNGKKYFIKLNKDLENLTPETIQAAEFREIISQLEPACWAWYRLVTPDIVSKSVIAVIKYSYNEGQYQRVAVASEAIPGYVANRSAPLQESDLVVEFFAHDFHEKRNGLIELLSQLSKSLDRSTATEQPAAAPAKASRLSMNSFWNMASKVVNNAKQTFNAYYSKESAAALKPFIDQMIKDIKSDASCSSQKINQLVSELTKRKRHVKELCAYYEKYQDPVSQASLKQYQDELAVLDSTIKLACPNVITLDKVNNVVTRIIKETELALLQKINVLKQQLAKEGKKLSGVDFTLFDQPLHFSAEDIENLEENGLYDRWVFDKLLNTNRNVVVKLSDGKPINLKLSDIKNYRRKKGLAQAHVQSYISAENDYHNKNGASDGSRVDHDMSEWPFFRNFKKVNWAEWLGQALTSAHNQFKSAFSQFIDPRAKATEEICPFTEYDIVSLPNLRDDKRRYWPTEANNLTQLSQTAVVIPFYENFYTSDDNLVYQKLNGEPDYNFNKFKTYLKNVLVPDSAYRQSIEDIIQKGMLDPTISSETKSEGVTLLESFLAYKLDRMHKFRSQLVKIAEFREFLEEYGDYALQSIKEEFAAEQDPAFKINIDEIETIYQQIVAETKLAKTQSSPENKVSATANPSLTNDNNVAGSSITTAVSSMFYKPATPPASANAPAATNDSKMTASTVMLQKH